MTQDKYAEIVTEIDKLMTKCKELVPDKFAGDKHMIFQRFREISHWLRDVFELSELERQNETTKRKFEVHSGPADDRHA